MNKKYLTIAAVVATLALVAAPFALAQRMRGGPHGGPGELGGVMFLGHLQHAKQALGLSDQQVSDIETIFKDLHTQNAQYRDIRSAVPGISHPTLNVGRIEGGTNTNVVPGKVVFKLDRRMIPDEDPQ